MLGKKVTLFYLLMMFPEFRNLLYHRTKRHNPICTAIISVVLPPMNTLFIHTKDIGPGLFIQHGFATVISAKSIGSNCHINQQVTIGYTAPGKSPVIGNNVNVSAGAKVLGAITVGDNCTIGANAVVVKDVPPRCVVVGVPARIIKRGGVRTDEPL